MKALLVLDMPYSCADCRFCEYEDSIKSSFCTADPSHMFKMNEEGGVYSMRRDFSCPLKSLPQRYDEDVMREQKGWNRCLDEILGDSK